MKDGKPELNAACRVCGICVKNLPGEGDAPAGNAGWHPWTRASGRTSWCLPRSADGRLHPVSLELIGKARELAQRAPGFQVKAVLLGDGVMEPCAGTAALRGQRSSCRIDDPALGYFRADVLRNMRGGLHSRGAAQRGAGGRHVAGAQPGAEAVHTLSYRPDGRLHAA